MRREHHSHQQSKQQKRNGIFIFKSQPCHHAKPEPITRIAGIDGPQDQPDAGHPDELFKHIVCQPRVRQQIKRNHKNGQSRHALGKTASAHFSRQRARKPYHGCSGKDWQQAHSQRRIAQHHARKPRDPNSERRMINVSPSHVPRTRQVIHFVAKNAVTRNHQQMQQQFGRDDVKHDRRAGEKRLCGASRAIELVVAPCRSRAIRVHSRLLSLICDHQQLICSSLLRIQYHFPELLAFFQPLMRRRGFTQWETLVHYWFDLAGEDVLHHFMKVAHGPHKRSQK